MKRILFIEGNTDGTIGGSYYSLLYLIQGLDRSKYEPHVVFLQDHVLVPLYRKVTPNIYIHSEWSDRSGRDIRGWRYLRDVFMKYRLMQRMIATVKPDLVHLNNGYANIEGWVLACYVHGVKIIATRQGNGLSLQFQDENILQIP